VTDPETTLVIGQRQCKQYASASLTGRLLPRIWLLLSCPPFNKKAYLTPGKRATAVCVWRLVFAISPLFEPPSWGMPCDINAIYTSLKSI